MGERKGTRSNFSRYCFLRDDDNLRNTIRFMIESSDKERYEISEELGIHNYRLTKYLDGATRQRITQFQLLLLCNYFSIEPEIIIKFIDK